MKKWQEALIVLAIGLIISLLVNFILMWLLNYVLAIFTTATLTYWQTYALWVLFGWISNSLKYNGGKN